MKVLVSGSTGLVGSHLVRRLTELGHRPVRLVRKPLGGAEPEIVYDIAAGRMETEPLKALDAVVHLAGENIAGKWTAERKEAIYDSRIRSTRAIADALAAMDSPPPVFVCASAIGYYGNRGDEVLDEASEPGEGFLPRVCMDWEAAAQPARTKGVRVVNLRTGVVLSKHGGALAQMLLPFGLGLGGVVGNGKQWMSWIGLRDVVDIIVFVLENDGLNEPVNVVAPNPVTNREFTRTLGIVLRRPTLLPMPGFAVKALFGEMGETLLLGGARVLPKRLEESGYRFRHSQLDDALVQHLK